MSLEDVTVREESGAFRRTEEAKPKEQREKKGQETEAKSLGLKIYAAESNRFPDPVTYEELVEGTKKGKYKITYTEKKTESEIISMIV